MIRASGSAGRRVLLELLRNPEEPLAARAVADRTGLAVASVNDILRFLRFHAAISQGRPARVRAPRLAELASQLRLPDLVPVRSLQVPGPAKSIATVLRNEGVDHVFAFTTAANRWAFFEPDPVTHLVVGSRAAGAAARVLQSDDAVLDGHRVLIYEDDLSVLDIETLGGHKLTSRLQTWIDLKHFPHAGAHAAFFSQIVGQIHPWLVAH